MHGPVSSGRAAQNLNGGSGLLPGFGLPVTASPSELHLVTVSKVAEVLDDLKPHADVVRVVLDLRGLTFMDLPGLDELIRQNTYARTNHHNLAVVRGTDALNRLLRLTGVEDILVLVDDPDDLAPAPVTP